MKDAGFTAKALLDCDYGGYSALFCRYHKGKALYGEDGFGIDEDDFDEDADSVDRWDLVDDTFEDIIEKLSKSELTEEIKCDKYAREEVDDLELERDD